MKPHKIFEYRKGHELEKKHHGLFESIDKKMNLRNFFIFVIIF